MCLVCRNRVDKSISGGLQPPPEREFYFKGTESGTQMFLQLAELAALRLAPIRVANAGRGARSAHLAQTHAAPLPRKLRPRWAAHPPAEEQQCPEHRAGHASSHPTAPPRDSLTRTRLDWALLGPIPALCRLPIPYHCAPSFFPPALASKPGGKPLVERTCVLVAWGF